MLRSFPVPLPARLAAAALVLAAWTCSADAVEDPVEAGLAEDAQPVRGRVSLPAGIQATLDDEAVLLNGRAAWALLGYDPAQANGLPPPDGVILREQDLPQERAREERSYSAGRQHFRAEPGPQWTIAVHWEDGWVDPSLDEVHPPELLLVLGMYAKGFNQLQSAPFSAKVQVDSWTREPALDRSRGVLSYGINLRWQGSRMDGSVAGPSIYEVVLAEAFLGKKGTLRLVGRGLSPSRSNLERNLAAIATRLAWPPGQGFHPRAPEGIAERSGGVRSLIVPRLGEDREDATTTRPSGAPIRFGWLLWAVPLAVAVVVVWSKIRRQAGGSTGSSAGAAATQSQPALAGRCHACGSSLPASTARCMACGASLVRS